MATTDADRRRWLETIAANLRGEALAAEVIRVLNEAGHRGILLRGPTTARWLYEDGYRAYSDIDILVDMAEYADCERVLGQIGFRRSLIELMLPDERPQHAGTWSRNGETVDLHLTVVGARVPASEAWRVLSARTERWEISGADVEVLDASARALLLALHAAQHGSSFGHTGQDLERALSQLPASLWVEARELARVLEAEPALAVGLLSVSAGAALCAELGLDGDAVVAAEGSTSFHAVQGLVWLGQTRGARSKVRYLGSKLFPPVSFMRSRFPGARRGRIALALAYLSRLAALAWHAPAVVRGVLRLRRQRQGIDSSGR